MSQSVERPTPPFIPENAITLFIVYIIKIPSRAIGCRLSETGTVRLFIVLDLWCCNPSETYIYDKSVTYTKSCELDVCNAYPKQSGYLNGGERCGCRSPLYFSGMPLQNCVLALPSQTTTYILFRVVASSGQQTLNVSALHAYNTYILLRALAPFGCKGKTFIWNMQES